MAVKKVNEASLTAVANSIRAKAGINNQLIFPSGFVSAVQAIQAGGEDNLDRLLGVGSPFTEYSNNSAKVIAKYLFCEQDKLKKIEFKNARTIGINCFFNCGNLEEAIIPEVTEIQEGAFYQCSNLKLSELPKGLTTLGYRAFSGCSTIEIKEIPEGLKEINTNTFRYCHKIVNLTFKGKMNSIDSTAFRDCNNLLTINVPWAEGEISGAPWGATNATINYNYVEGE